MLLIVRTYPSVCPSVRLSVCLQIHTSLINGRPSATDPSPTLLNFTSARYIRLVFQRIRTLNADLMTLTLHDTKDMDPIVTRRVRHTFGYVIRYLIMRVTQCYQILNPRSD